MSQNPLILAVETSSRIGSVAIAADEKIYKEIVFSGQMKHSVEIFPAISNLLQFIGRKPCNIEHIYISNGPGSFTGLRIAVTFAKIMHLANRTRVIAVDTLDVIASNVVDNFRENHKQKDLTAKKGACFEKIAAILDAKRGQFYIAVYQRLGNNGSADDGGFENFYKKILPDSLMSASEFLAQFASPENPIGLLGDGLVYHRQTFESAGTCFLDEKYWSPRANKVHLLGWQMALRDEFTDPVGLTPYYLSRPAVTLKSR
jgi:tRNA threonylcarbamoyladenosine biosynthesis protein TsaB